MSNMLTDLLACILLALVILAIAGMQWVIDYARKEQI